MNLDVPLPEPLGERRMDRSGHNGVDQLNLDVAVNVRPDYARVMRCLALGVMLDVLLSKGLDGQRLGVSVLLAYVLVKLAAESSRLEAVSELDMVYFSH